MHGNRIAFISRVTFALILAASAVHAQTPTVGLVVHDKRAQPGYTLFAPMNSQDTFLIDIDAHLVHSWRSSYTPGLMAYLTEEGHLLRAASLAPNVDAHWTSAAGGGGRLEEYDWDGNLVWSYDYSDALRLQHHDFKKLPNGNVLFLAWTWKTAAEAVARGRRPGFGMAFWPDSIVEVRPTGPTTGDIVWEWTSWDHLIQDLDATKANYGVVADHPELLDINALTADGPNDFNHLNAVAYNPDLDQIAVSSRGFSEIWIIDHSTTTAEAAGHSGGRSGMGGDILYRWGNPQQYKRGTAADRRFYTQHDIQWIPPGYPGEGHLLAFNNGTGRPDGTYSSADEIVPPLNGGGTYDLAPGAIYGPADPVWTYTATPRGSFLSPIIAGVQRMPNGNTLICEGTKGTLFEVTNGSETAWRYVSPVRNTGPVNQGDSVGGGIAQPNAIFKARRYPEDYPGLAGHDLTPGDVVEIYNPPSPVPDGTLGTTPLRAWKIDTAGSQVRVTWDSTTCPSPDYNLIYGMLPDVRTMTLAGSDCALGTSGTHAWSSVPPGNVFLLLVGVGDYPIYESSWGTDSFGRERNSTHPSLECGVTTKSLSATCP